MFLRSLPLSLYHSGNSFMVLAVQDKCLAFFCWAFVCNSLCLWLLSLTFLTLTECSQGAVSPLGDLILLGVTHRAVAARCVESGHGKCT